MNTRTEKLALFLKKLYDATKESSTNPTIIDEIGKQTAIPSISKVKVLLRRLGIVEITNKNRVRTTKWIGQEPNYNFARCVNHELTELCRNYTRTSRKRQEARIKQEQIECNTVKEKIKKEKILNIPEIISIEPVEINAIITKGDRSDKEFRVHMLLQYLYEKLKDLVLSDANLDLYNKLSQYYLEEEIIDVLAANKLIIRDYDRENIIYTWADGAPSEEMAKLVCNQLLIYLNIHKTRNRFVNPTKHKSFNENEIKVISLLKESGKTFKQISNLIEKPESTVKEMLFDFLIRTN